MKARRIKIPKQIPFPKRLYSIIYADPPWSYRDKHAGGGNRGSADQYPCMSIEDICNLPVKNIAMKDCALFLWATMPKLDEVFSVIEAWGFVYKTCAFTWVKRNKKSDNWFFGLGHWTRANAELCLLGIRGKPHRASASVHSVIDTPLRGHSQKPKIVRERIVELCGDSSRIELFARERVPGWDAWGNEVETDEG